MGVGLWQHYRCSSGASCSLSQLQYGMCNSTEKGHCLSEFVNEFVFAKDIQNGWCINHAPCLYICEHCAKLIMSATRRIWISGLE